MTRLSRLRRMVGFRVIRDPLLVITMSQTGYCHVQGYADLPREAIADALRQLAQQIEERSALSDRMN